MYHVNAAGNVMPCKAALRTCPFDDALHFSAPEVARLAFETTMEPWRPNLSGPALIPVGDHNPLLEKARLTMKRNAWEEESPHLTSSGCRYFFLTVENFTVATIKIHDSSSGPELHDIETRPGYKNQGYAKTLLSKLAKLYGVSRINHTGGYTPDGFNYVSKLLSRSGAYEQEAKITFPNYSDEKPFTVMNDWDEQLTRWDG